MNLPAYLQNSPAKKLNETALLGIGSSLPPHISIRGNTFTLIDASGAQQNAGPTLDANVADISDVVCKQFYGEKWTPDSNEPPKCWSANGIAPSREAIEPQSATCDGCPHNVRGSAVSQISGAAVKACRDERWLALILPAFPTMKFQLRLTPGSFKNWQGYIKTCEGSQTDVSDVVTRVTFQAGVNGVLQFQAVSYIDEATAAQRNAGYAEKAFDALVGRLDRPIQAALPAPAAPSAAPATAPLLAPASANGAFAPAEPPKRTRRTKAQIEADNAAQAGQPVAAPQPTGFAAPAPAAPIAPFRPQPAANAAPSFTGAQQVPAGTPQPAVVGNAGFGIQQGVAPNPEIQAALQGLFGKK